MCETDFTAVWWFWCECGSLIDPSCHRLLSHEYVLPSCIASGEQAGYCYRAERILSSLGCYWVQPQPCAPQPCALCLSVQHQVARHMKYLMQPQGRPAIYRCSALLCYTIESMLPIAHFSPKSAVALVYLTVVCPCIEVSEPPITTHHLCCERIRHQHMSRMPQRMSIGPRAVFSKNPKS